MKYDVVTIGAATRDVFLKANIKPQIDKKSITHESICFPLGSKNEIEEIFISTGGGATNAAVTFARQGLKVSCISRIGSDKTGQEILHELKKEKVDTSLIQKDKKPKTGYSTIIVANDGSRVILVRRGVSADIKFSQINLDKIKTKWFYITSLAGNLNLLKKILTYAQKNGIKTALNPGSRELKEGIGKLRPIFKKVDVLVLNQDEASALLGIPFEKEYKIFRELDKMVTHIAVMTKGKNGVSVFDGEYIYSASTPNSPVIERTGAGDAFGSGFVSYLARGKPIEEAIQFAVANSTSVIQYFSAKTGILKKGSFGKYKKVKVIKQK